MITNTDIRAYRADLHRIAQDYTNQHKDAWEIEILDALGQIIDKHYYKITPRVWCEVPADFIEELTQLLKEYADSNGAELADVLGVLTIVLEERIDEMIARGRAEDDY